MRLAYIYPFRFPSASAHSIQVLNTCHAIAMTGCDVDLWVNRSDDNALEDVLRSYGLEPTEHLNINFLPKNKTLASLLLRYYLFRDRKKSVFFCRRLGFIPFISAVSSKGVICELHKFGKKQVKAAKNATQVIVISEMLREALIAEGVPAEKITTLPSAASSSLLKMAKTLPGRLEPQRRVVYTGSLSSWKGVDVLIRSLTFTDAHALIVGGRRDGPDPDREFLQKLCKDIGVSDRVTFAGYVPYRDVHSLFLQDDICVIPTRGGDSQDISNSPIKLFEYRALGLPVIATRMPSFQSVIAENVNGLLFDEGDSRALSGCIQKLVADLGLSRQLGAAGFELAKTQTWEHRAQRILEIAKDIN